MPQSNVGIRINIDAGQARGQVQDLSNVIADLNKQMKEAAEAKDWKSVAQLSQAVDSATSGRGQIMAQARQAQAGQQAQAATGGLFGGSGMWVLQQSLNQITHGILTAWDAALTAAKQRASGDYTGAAVTQKRAREEAIGQGVGSLVGALGFLGGPVIGMMTTALGGEIGKFIGGIGAKKMEENLAWSAQYKSAFQGIDTLNQLYGGAINKKSSDENSNYGIAMRGRAVEAARGTGLDTEDFIQALKQSGGYGIRSETQAMNMLRTQALWSRFTGADLGAIQRFAGQAYRYNGETNATATAYGGLMAQGMGKGQFTEFMSAIERAMADGISKGYVKSTQEIAGNMVMMYKLSGGSALWQGEQGAQRLSQMSSSIAGAAALETPAHVMVYSAVNGLLNEGGPEKRKENYEMLMRFGDMSAADKKLLAPTGTYIDNMALIEKMGASGKMLGSMKQMVEGFEGDNIAGIIEWYKQIYGLNNLGGLQLYNMMKDKSTSEIMSDSFEKEVKDNVLNNKDYKSDSQRYQDMINELGQLGVKIGQIEFPKTEMVALTAALKDLEAVYRERLSPSSPLPSPPTPSQELPRGASDAERQTYANRYFLGAQIPGLSPEYQAVQDEYNRLMNYYAGGDIEMERVLGWASSLSPLRDVWSQVEYRPTRTDDSIVYDLERLLRELQQDFHSIANRISFTPIEPIEIRVSTDY